ncbi:transcription antitermination factor NusB [Mycoplasma sp. P36-A1]|uniref:transcription antitermination factor NusB n=1 Tax=Mycoplasma sp. P36-A1 TaxID=3252900 RepID=UPI003C2FE7C7
MINNNSNLSRKEAREASLIYIYQYLIEEEYTSANKLEFSLDLFNKENSEDIEVIIVEKFKKTNEISLFDDELFLSIVAGMKQADLIKKDLDNYLDSKWKFDRLGKIEQAILLISYIQIKGKLAPKGIVINEAVNLAKAYAEDDSYKFINGVLDKLN